MLTIGLFALSLMAGPGIGRPDLTSPIYLACEMKQTDGPQQVDISLDESAGQASVTIVKTGSILTGKGVFSPETVAFTTPVGDGRYFIFDWTISRIDLSVARHEQYTGFTDKGTCVIRKLPADRKL